MSKYNTVSLEIQNLINNLDEPTLVNLKTKLSETTDKITIKEFSGSNLILVSNKFSKNTPLLSNLEKECRSIILDKNTLKVVCYTYDDIYYNQDAKNYVLENDSLTQIIMECFEGTLLSVFNYNDIWHVSTRKCIDARNSKWKNDKSFYDLFLDCIDSEDTFFSNLKKENNYYFVLVHHLNKHLIDYSETFGNNYNKLIHVMTRESDTSKEISLDNIEQWGDKTIHFEQPTIYKDYSILNEYNKLDKLELPIKSEGVLVKIYNPENGKSDILKLQTNAYQFMSMLMPNNNNIFKSFVELYQNDLLKNHLEYFTDNCKFTEDGFEYDTIGVIDAEFKVLTSELFELFKHQYNFKNCTHKNKDYYSVLPSEYKTVLYKIRGIYFKKKEKYIKYKKQLEEDGKDLKLTHTLGLRIADIYKLLKGYDTRELLRLFQARKQILLECQESPDSENSILFNQFSNRCDKVSVRMSYVLLNKIFTKTELNFNHLIEDLSCEINL